MNAITMPRFTRRELLAAGGAVVVSFSLRPPEAIAQSAEKTKLPGSLEKTPMLDSWIALDTSGRVTVFTGKAELGQGIMTALIQCAAEEIDINPAAVTLVTADTERTPNEGYTAGSHSMEESGTAILNAAAQVRGILIDLAAARLALPRDRLKTMGGSVIADDGRSIAYKNLVSGLNLHRRAQPTSPLKNPKSFTVIGKSLPRIDIPPKLTGAPVYVQDMRPEGMLHARAVRPPGYHARLTKLDAGPIEKMPGVVKVIRDGSFLAVVATREFQAIRAMNALSQAAEWEWTGTLPEQAHIHKVLESLPAQNITVQNKGTPQSGAHSLQATYRRPYELHGAIGPSCAVAKLDGDKLTVWTHSQGVFPLRNTLAEMLKMPKEKVHCIQVQGSGCYGHNAADDAAADAALIARALPGKPIRVQWMREQENGWEPFGPAMSSHVAASLDSNGKIVSWQYEVWSNPHSTRPAGPPGNLVAPRYIAEPFPQPPVKPIPMPAGGGDRNSIPLYTIPNAHIVYHFIPQMPLRVSALRALGGYHNVFTIESFMDELAAVAKADPVDFRLRHLDDPRARDVIAKVVKEFNWKPNDKLPRGRGRGFAFARYKNLAAYCAVAVDLAVEHETGTVQLGRVVAAIDSGQAVNPDGIRNQIEGAIVQSASWTLFEEVTFDRHTITSRDWSSFPMIRFPALPESVAVHVIDRPGEKFLGTGEAGQGPAAAAIANAIADATGKRFRDLPLTAARIKAAIGV